METLPLGNPGEPGAGRKLSIDGLRLRLDLRIVPSAPGSSQSTAAATWRVEDARMATLPLGLSTFYRQVAVATGLAAMLLAVGIWFGGSTNDSATTVGASEFFAPNAAPARSAPPDITPSPAAAPRSPAAPGVAPRIAIASDARSGAPVEPANERGPAVSPAHVEARTELAPRTHVAAPGGPPQRTPPVQASPAARNPPAARRPSPAAATALPESSRDDSLDLFGDPK